VTVKILNGPALSNVTGMVILPAMAYKGTLAGSG